VNTWPTRLPDWLPSCDHCVLRWEWVALQQVTNAEFYVTCADVRIIGTSEPHDEFVANVSPVTVISHPFSHLPTSIDACTPETMGNCYRRVYQGNPVQIGEEYLYGPAIATYNGPLSPSQPPSPPSRPPTAPPPSPRPTPPSPPSSPPAPNTPPAPAPTPESPPSPFPANTCGLPDGVPINPPDVDSTGFARAHGRLRLDGVQLVDEAGAPVQLMGMSSHGLHWFPDCYTKSSIQYLVEHWGINVFRAAMYVGEQGYAQGAPWVKDSVKDIVRWTDELGIYVVIDWHVLNPGNPLDPVYSGATDFFEEMATWVVAEGFTHVIYETANEPNGVTWAQLKPYHEALIPAIRAIDAESIIIAGTPTWSQDIHEAAASPLIMPGNLPVHHVMYAFHFYAGTHASLLARLQTYATEIPIFVSEWGTSTASGTGGVYFDTALDFLTAMADTSGVSLSFAQWSYADKAESSAALMPGACAAAQWDDVSCSGAFLRSYIKASVDATARPPSPPSPPPSPPAPPAPPSPPPSPTCELELSWEVYESWIGGFNARLHVSPWTTGERVALRPLGAGFTIVNAWNGLVKSDEGGVYILELTAGDWATFIGMTASGFSEAAEALCESQLVAPSPSPAAPRHPPPPSPSPPMPRSPLPPASPPASPSAPPSPMPPAPTPTPSSPPSPAGCPLSFSFAITEEWGQGFNGRVYATPWTQGALIELDWGTSGTTLNTVWNGHVVSTDADERYVTIRLPSYDTTFVGLNAAGTATTAPAVRCVTRL